jgi:hypothetical protein
MNDTEESRRATRNPTALALHTQRTYIDLMGSCSIEISASNVLCGYVQA